MNAIFKRVSIRKFEDRPVEQEKITTLLRAAMAAPSACNQQPWEYYVVTDKEKILALSTASPYAMCAKNAPLVFVPCSRKTKGITAPDYINIDMSASVENLLLEAVELELGAVWLGIAPGEDRMEYVRQVLNLPDDLNAFTLIPCGYPAKVKEPQDRYEECRVHYVK